MFDTDYSLDDKHYKLLRYDRLLSEEVMAARGYKSIRGREDLISYGLSESTITSFPSLLIPSYSTRGSCNYGVLQTKFFGIPSSWIIGFPKAELILSDIDNAKGHLVDCPPICRKFLKNPKIPIYLTQSIIFSDSLASRGLCSLSIVHLGDLIDGNCNLINYLNYSFEPIEWKNREVRIVIDFSDIENTMNVDIINAMNNYLEPKGAKAAALFIPDKYELSKFGYLTDKNNNIRIKKLPSLPTEKFDEISDDKYLECKIITLIALSKFATIKYCRRFPEKDSNNEFCFSVTQINTIIRKFLSKAGYKEIKKILTKRNTRTVLMNFFCPFTFPKGEEPNQFNCSWSRLQNLFSDYLIKFPDEES